MRTFCEQPDWDEPPAAPYWRSLFDPALTSDFAPPAQRQPQPQARPGTQLAPRQERLPTGLRRWSAPDSRLILRALWQELQEQGPHLATNADRPLAHPDFFLIMSLIYAASYPPDATPWESAQHPYASLYLLRHYLSLHPRLRQALSQALVRGSSSIRWSTPLVTHKMQTVVDLFLRYHGLHSRGSLTVTAIGPWAQSDDRGDFAIRVRLHPEVLLGAEAEAIVPTPEEVAAAEQALAWVLTALFAYSQELGLKQTPFW